MKLVLALLTLVALVGLSGTPSGADPNGNATGFTFSDGDGHSCYVYAVGHTTEYANGVAYKANSYSIDECFSIYNGVRSVLGYTYYEDVGDAVASLWYGGAAYNGDHKPCYVLFHCATIYFADHA